jgi:hypothetical protein
MAEAAPAHMSSLKRRPIYGEIRFGGKFTDLRNFIFLSHIILGKPPLLDTIFFCCTPYAARLSHEEGSVTGVRGSVGV